MARSHYSYEKRRKELDKKKKKEEKRLRRLAKKAGDADEVSSEGGDTDGEATDEPIEEDTATKNAEAASEE